MRTAKEIANIFKNSYDATVHMDHRHVWDELDDIQEIVAEVRKMIPDERFCVWRRGRGIRKVHETYKGQYHSSLPLELANYVSVYILRRR